MAPAAAPPQASAPTPPAPAVERYTRPPVEPIEEAEPPAGVAGEDISALISQFASEAPSGIASEAAGPVDIERLTQEILDTMERNGPLTKELEAVIREAVRDAAEAGSEEGIVAEQLMAAAAPAATPTPVMLPRWRLRPLRPRSRKQGMRLPQKTVKRPAPLRRQSTRPLRRQPPHGIASPRHSRTPDTGDAHLHRNACSNA